MTPDELVAASRRARRRRRAGPIRAGCADRARRAAADGPGFGRRLVRRAGRGIATRRAARRRASRTACARHLRRAWRQDDGARRRPIRTALIVACDVRDRRMALLRRTVGATGAANVRARPGRSAQAAALPGPLRLRDRRRAVFGPGHASARSGYPMAAARTPTSPHSPPHSSRCCATRPPRSRRAAASSTRPARASPRRTRTLRRPSSRAPTGSCRVDARAGASRACRRTSSTRAATCGPNRIGTGSRRSSAPCSSRRAATSRRP